MVVFRRVLFLLLFGNLLSSQIVSAHPPPIPTEIREDGSVIETTPALIIDCQDNITCTLNDGVIEIDTGAGGGTSQWTDTGTVLHPNEETLDNVVVGGTTQAGADIILNVDGSAVFNEQGASVDFIVEGNTVENLFVVDGSDDDVEITGGLNINLPADDNVTIDGRSNPRTVTVGSMRFNHTPEANTPNTRAIFFDVDYNSVPNTEAIHMMLTATDMAAGETMIGIDIEGDMNASSGGVLRGLNIGKIPGTGSGELHAIHIEPEVDIVISHASGTFGTLLQGWDENGGFTDTTTAFNTSDIGDVNNVTIFSANADAIYIGSATVFSVIEFVGETLAANPGIKPTFEYSSGGGTPVWTPFTPTDGTAGFREDGLLTWSIADLTSPTWAVATVNGQSAFYIQITRTQGGSLTIVEDLFEISTPTIFKWDGNGQVFVGALTTGVNSRTVTTEGSSETTQIVAHINDSDSETIELTAMRHSDTASAGAILYGIRSNGTHAAQTTVVDNDVIFQLKTAGHDGTDFNDLASIFFEVDGGVSGNDMPGRIVFKTSADGGNSLGEALRLDNAKQATFAGIIADNDDMVFEVDADDNGSNSFIWTDGTSTQIATLSEAGAYQIADDLIVSGGDITFGNIAARIGDGVTDSITLSTDGTGNTEIVLPDDSIGDAELDWDNFTDLSAGGVVDDDGHAHTTTTLSGIVNADLSGSAGITSGNLDLTMTPTWTGLHLFNANLSIGNAATSSGVLTILEDTTDGTEFLSFQVPALTANTVYTWPDNDGDPNQVLKTDGSGVLDWVANAGGGGGTGFKVLKVESTKITGGFITAGAQIDAGDGNWRLLFDADVTESGLWQFRMPSTFSSGLVAKIQYSMTSATTDKIDWEVEVMAVADGEAINSASFDTVNEVTGGTTVPGTAGLLDSISITLTNADSIAAGELCFIRVNRDHDDGDDTAQGDGELVSLTIEWTE